MSRPRGRRMSQGPDGILSPEGDEWQGNGMNGNGMVVEEDGTQPGGEDQGTHFNHSGFSFNGHHYGQEGDDEYHEDEDEEAGPCSQTSIGVGAAEEMEDSDDSADPEYDSSFRSQPGSKQILDRIHGQVVLTPLLIKAGLAPCLSTLQPFARPHTVPRSESINGLVAEQTDGSGAGRFRPLPSLSHRPPPSPHLPPLPSPTPLPYPQVLDTSEFQRLKGLAQLGGCHWVYPAATHTRFEHSIGVAVLAGKQVRQSISQLPFALPSLAAPCRPFLLFRPVRSCPDVWYVTLSYPVCLALHRYDTCSRRSLAWKSPIKM